MRHAVALTKPTTAGAVEGGRSSGCMSIRVVLCAAFEPPPAPPRAFAKPAPAATNVASGSYAARSAATRSAISADDGSTNISERATVDNDTPL
jgi:hypothetical protein